MKKTLSLILSCTLILSACNSVQPIRPGVFVTNRLKSGNSHVMPYTTTFKIDNGNAVNIADTTARCTIVGDTIHCTVNGIETLYWKESWM